MRLRPTDAHLYAFTHPERDTVVIALRSLIEDAADGLRSPKRAVIAARLLERMMRDEV